MKVQFSFPIFLSFVCLFVFASATAAQEKPWALKFDEFEDSAKRSAYVYDEITLAQPVPTPTVDEKFVVHKPITKPRRRKK